MPDLIRYPVLPLDSGVRRNDKHKVFVRRVNIMKIGRTQKVTELRL
jgi:hypothetical protein